MDPFVEKELIEVLKKISEKLGGIEEQLTNLNIVVRESTLLRDDLEDFEIEDENELEKKEGKLNNKIGSEFEDSADPEEKFLVIPEDADVNDDDIDDEKLEGL